MRIPTKAIIPAICMLAMSCSDVGAQTLNGSIQRVDFANFTHHQFWGRRPIKLKQGKMEFESDGCRTEYKLKKISYVDLTRDRIEEALVHIEDYTACGSSGVSDNYYIYTLRRGRPYLLWRFGTGSEGVAGLKDFKLAGRMLVFELFGKYRIKGAKFVEAGEEAIGECCPTHYSRIGVAWDGMRFRQRSMKILAFPYKSIQDYYLAVGYPRR
jgi:hypothetical protein